jgi:hypothetical protein
MILMQAAQTSEVMKIRLSFYNDMLYNYHILANAGDSSVIDSGICNANHDGVGEWLIMRE